jgi:hypothetical protein
MLISPTGLCYYPTLILFSAFPDTDDGAIDAIPKIDQFSDSYLGIGKRHDRPHTI